MMEDLSKIHTPQRAFCGRFHLPFQTNRKSQIKRVKSSNRLGVSAAAQGGISSEDACNWDLTQRQTCRSEGDVPLMASAVPSVQPGRLSVPSLR